MTLNRARLSEVLSADYTYYRGPEPIEQIDDRLKPTASALLAAELRADMAVLDVGCGDGATLLGHADHFAHGVGIDNDESHLELANAARNVAGHDHVEFHRLEVDQLPAQPWRDHFDLVFSERGPVGYDARGVQAALRVLRPDGLLFAEVIGELHHQEVREVFGGQRRLAQMIKVRDQVAVAMERNGVEIRVAADLVTKRYYPDVYEWLKFQCSIWAWSGQPFPAVDDPRLPLFAERSTDSSGRIVTTHHVVWVGGVKTAGASPYGEYDQFAATRQEPASRSRRGHG